MEEKETSHILKNDYTRSVKKWSRVAKVGTLVILFTLAYKMIDSYPKEEKTNKTVKPTVRYGACTYQCTSHPKNNLPCTQKCQLPHGSTPVYSQKTYEILTTN